MAIKCAAGSLGSREREILAAARIADTYQIPFALVTDGKTAVLLDTLSSKKIGEGLDMIPSKQELSAYAKNAALVPLPAERRRREKLIFRSYDSMNVNRR
jgi:pyruvate/2-oxoacid:ferredoxin oxidoreductase alpha subunit